MEFESERIVFKVVEVIFFNEVIPRDAQKWKWRGFKIQNIFKKLRTDYGCFRLLEKQRGD